MQICLFTICFSNQAIIPQLNCQRPHKHYRFRYSIKNIKNFYFLSKTRARFPLAWTFGNCNCLPNYKVQLTVKQFDFGKFFIIFRIFSCFIVLAIFIGILQLVCCSQQSQRIWISINTSIAANNSKAHTQTHPHTVREVSRINWENKKYYKKKFSARICRMSACMCMSVRRKEAKKNAKLWGRDQ